VTRNLPSPLIYEFHPDGNPDQRRLARRVYALVALGYTMVYGVLGMINFAHGEIFMIGMFACVYAMGVFSVAWGDHVALNLGLGILVAMIFSAAYGYANERIAYRRLRKAHVLAPLTSAIGISTFLQYFIFLTVSKETVNFPRYYSDWLTEPPHSFSARSTSPTCKLAILGLTLVIMAGLFYLINFTRLGIALRATAQDQLMASLVGIPVDKIIAFTFILGSALAAIAGVMVSMYNNVLVFDAGYRVGLKAFTAAILGGIGNVPGAVLGAMILGLTEALTTWLRQRVGRRDHLRHADAGAAAAPARPARRTGRRQGVTV
jgi:branched-chain amino acid transport system permease protein